MIGKDTCKEQFYESSPVLLTLWYNWSFKDALCKHSLHWVLGDTWKGLKRMSNDSGSLFTWLTLLQVGLFLTASSTLLLFCYSSKKQYKSWDPLDLLWGKNKKTSSLFFGFSSIQCFSWIPCTSSLHVSPLCLWFQLIKLATLLPVSFCFVLLVKCLSLDIV